MIALNKALFARMYFEAYGDDSFRYHACIATTDDDKEFIKRTKSVHLLQSLNLKLALILQQDDSLYLVVYGGHQFTSLPPEVRLQRLDEDAGVLTVLGGEQILGLRDPTVLSDRNWSTVKSSERGELELLTRVDKDEMIELFEEFSFYRVDQLPFYPLDGGEDRFLMLFLLLLDVGDKDKLELKDKFLSLVVNLDGFPFHLLHSAYVSQTWHYSYIDIYRCVELLYPIPRMIELRGLVEARVKSGLDSQLLAIELFRDVNKATGWREIELSGLERLVKSCNPESVSRAFDTLKHAGVVDGDDLEIVKELSKIELMKLAVMGGLVETIRDKLVKLPQADISIVTEYRAKKSAALIANALYSTRNELVHFRLPRESIDERKVKVSFKALVYILSDLYQRYQSEAYA